MSSGEKNNTKDGGSNRSSAEGVDRSLRVDTEEPGRSSSSIANARETDAAKAQPIGPSSTINIVSDADFMAKAAGVMQEKKKLEEELSNARILTKGLRKELEAAQRKHAVNLQKKQDEIERLSEELNQIKYAPSNATVPESPKAQIQQASASKNSPFKKTRSGLGVLHSAAQSGETISIDRSVLEKLYSGVLQQANQVKTLLDTSETNETLLEHPTSTRIAPTCSSSNAFQDPQSGNSSLSTPQRGTEPPETNTRRELKRRSQSEQQSLETIAKSGESPSKKTRLEESLETIPSGFPSISSTVAPNKGIAATTRETLSEVNNDMPPPKPRFSSHKKIPDSPSLARQERIPVSSATSMDVDDFDFTTSMDEGPVKYNFEPEAKSDDSQDADLTHEIAGCDKENDVIQGEINSQPQRKSKKQHKAFIEDTIVQARRDSGSKLQQTPQRRIPPTQSDTLTQSQQSISTSAQTQMQHVHSPSAIASLSFAKATAAPRTIPLNFAAQAEVAASSIPPQHSSNHRESNDDEESKTVDDAEHANSRPKREATIKRSSRPVRAAAAKIKSLEELPVDEDGNWLNKKARQKEEEMFCSGPDEPSKARKSSKKQQQSNDGQAKNKKPQADAAASEHDGASATAVSASPTKPSLSRGSSYGSRS